tara:strand:- start:446 stop:1030 length:585 start_codon:yes stop_codon:yes gene_type:complete
MKELLAIIIVLLIYISIQLTHQQKEPVNKSKKHIVKHVTNNVNEIEVLQEAPKRQQVIERTPNIMINNPQCHNSMNSNPPSFVPINIPTRGPSENYRQIGVLTNSDNSEILPLFGKRIWCGATKWMYYTQTNKFVSVHLPVFSNKRDCSAEYGCDELSDKDIVTVPQFNDSFTVTLYNFDGPRYIPYIDSNGCC